MQYANPIVLSEISIFSLINIERKNKNKRLAGKHNSFIKILLWFTYWWSDFFFITAPPIGTPQLVIVNYQKWIAWHWLDLLRSIKKLVQNIWKIIVLRSLRNYANSNGYREGFWKPSIRFIRMLLVLMSAVNYVWVLHTGKSNS